MISVARPWLICGYHSLTIVTMFSFIYFCWKTKVNCRKGIQTCLVAGPQSIAARRTLKVSFPVHQKLALKTIGGAS